MTNANKNIILWYWTVLPKISHHPASQLSQDTAGLQFQWETVHKLNDNYAFYKSIKFEIKGKIQNNTILYRVPLMKNF